MDDLDQPPRLGQREQRHPILRRINLALLGIGLLSVIIAGTAIYTSLRVRDVTNSTVDQDLPDALDLDRMLAGIRLMSANASEYLLGESDEYAEFDQNYLDYLDAHSAVDQRAEGSPERAESLAVLGGLMAELHDIYKSEIFDAYDPADRVVAGAKVDQVMVAVGAPLEAKLEALAADMRSDGATLSSGGEVEEIEAYLQLVDEAGDMTNALNRHLLSDQSGRTDFYLNAAEFEQWLAIARSHEHDDRTVETIDEVERLYRELRVAGRDLFETYSPDIRLRAVRSLDEIEHMQFDAAETLMESLGDEARERAGRSARELSATGDVTLMIVIISILVTAALFILIAVFVRRSIYDPIVRLADAVETLRRGERTLRDTPTNDELGDVYQGLLGFQAELTELEDLRDKEREQRALLEREHSRVTEAMEHLRETQEELVASQRLAALGSLVAGVAHEVNTPVGAAVTVGTTLNRRIEEFMDRVESGRIGRKYLEAFRSDIDDGMRVMLGALQQASELIANFKQVAVDQSSENRRVFKVETHLNEIVNTLKHQLRGSDIRVDVACTTEASLDSYPGPFGQVISNLFANALAHGFDQREAGAIEIAASGGVDHVDILFADDGIGIPPEHLSRVFDPFYTTKLGQGGSGLGLHIVQNIVTGLLGGEISVQSVLGRGTTFRIRLPLVAPEAVDPTDAFEVGPTAPNSAGVSADTGPKSATVELAPASGDGTPDDAALLARSEEIVS